VFVIQLHQDHRATVVDLVRRHYRYTCEYHWIARRKEPGRIARPHGKVRLEHQPVGIPPLSHSEQTYMPARTMA